mmetsp:Transcript_33749/g.88791  ORF Transcript_33749/g.88791 Transcript_33749/m.88791 type:complete len:143 (-) Transcript_33749:310-738(-)|eukprot:CAMPEP_0115859014 /NCGR_PEP_ID=MMETSP0287-20121206/16394_1 /TAXON_ID=412157 /ORGANISM="Chrysochromulina rotalis, Strain UIO044" /LENGTH=142 /DNA_ID=CAMNT_0003313295 /DNA_START=21 /DNA_END=449 /DNA_ORIENTATION=+
MLALFLATASFQAPLTSAFTSNVVSSPRAASPVAIGGFKLPDFGGGSNFQLFPSDVNFMDVDGDDVVIRSASAGRVDLYVNKELKFEAASMKLNGNTLEITGKVKQGFAFLGALGFNLEDIVTEGVTPKDPAYLEKALALVE